VISQEIFLLAKKQAMEMSNDDDEMKEKMIGMEKKSVCRLRYIQLNYRRGGKEE
jgi:hypothetical protein